MLLNSTASGIGTISQDVSDGDNDAILNLSGLNAVLSEHRIDLEHGIVPEGFASTKKRNNATHIIKFKLN
jgi:hypothetical protein